MCVCLCVCDHDLFAVGNFLVYVTLENNACNNQYSLILNYCKISSEIV